MHLSNKFTLTKTIICCLIFISACSQKTQDSGFTYVVSSFNKLKDSKEPPPPSPPSYGPFNFIIDTAGQIYYYQLQAGKLKFLDGCTSDDKTPVFINLQPENIVQLSLTNIDDFITTNILHFESEYKYIGIACQQDTVTTIGLKRLIDIFSDTANHSKYFVRKTTQEENVVLDHKQRQIYYDANSVKWDSTEIMLPLNFTMPHVEKDK